MPSYLIALDDTQQWNGTRVKPKGRTFTLREMQKHVGGYIEQLFAVNYSHEHTIQRDINYTTVELRTGDFAIFGNEEARLIDTLNMRFNPIASAWLGHPIHGPVLCVGREHDAEYATEPYPDDHLETWE